MAAYLHLQVSFPSDVDGYKMLNLNIEPGQDLISCYRLKVTNNNKFNRTAVVAGRVEGPPVKSFYP